MNTDQREGDEYLSRINVDSYETRLLRKIPWWLDAGIQDPETLIRDLRDESRRLLHLGRKPCFSLLTPMWKTPPELLSELILSVRCQSWPHWELLLVDDGSPTKEHLDIAREWSDRDSRIRLFECEENRGISGARNFAIEQSRGDFLAILDHDDLLHPMALGLFARLINDDPSLNFLYSNEYQIDAEGQRLYGFYYKPLLDLFTLFRVNYVCHFAAIRRDLLMAAQHEGRVFRSEYDGCEDHDLFLRVMLTGQVNPRHLPLFLYAWRAVPTSCSMALEAKPEIPERRLAMLDELLPRAYHRASFRVAAGDPRRNEWHLNMRIRSIAGQDRPKTLVVIPFRDGARRLMKTLDALEAQRHDLDLHVALIDNGSIEPATRSLLENWLARPRKNRYVIQNDAGSPHFARLVNECVARTEIDAKLLLFLGPEVEIKSPEAVQTLAMQSLADPDAALLGLKILGPDGREVRHAGIKLFEIPDGSGYPRIGPIRQLREALHDEHVTLGVSLGCALIRREIFEKIGGFDEVLLTESFADLDLACRLIEAGHRNYYFGTLSAIDHGPDLSAWPPNRETELALLFDRHGKTLTTWRIRQLVHTTEPIWPLRAAPAASIVVAAAEALGPLPMRYKIADRLNRTARKLLGPVHGWLRSGAHATGRLVRRKNPSRPSNHGHHPKLPHFPRNRSVPASESSR